MHPIPDSIAVLDAIHDVYGDTTPIFLYGWSPADSGLFYDENGGIAVACNSAMWAAGSPDDNDFQDRGTYTYRSLLRDTRDKYYANSPKMCLCVDWG